MKIYKILLLTVIVFFMSNCEIKMQGANAKTVEFPTYRVNYPLDVTVYTRSGIEYRIFHTNYGGVAVVNHTKEQLEVELLRKALDNKN